MSLRQTSPIRQTDFIGRSVIPHGEGDAAIRIPNDVSKELELKPGTDGDLVDLRYDRDVPCLTIYFNRDARPDDRERLRAELEELELDDDQLDAILDALVEA